MRSSPSLISEVLPDELSFDMILIKGGEFRMGGTDDESDDNEKPVHGVSLPSFYLGKYPVTQSVWTAVMGNNPSLYKGNQRPVERVSWDDAQEFICKLNEITRKVYRLPSEAEWEYAARGGTLMEGDGYVYAGSDKLKQVGWYHGNSDGQTHDVGLKVPNELGLYDLNGNVYEWCQDQWHGYFEGAPDDGSAWEDRHKGASRVMRGGSWPYSSRDCRVASRHYYAPASLAEHLGFRLAVIPQSGG